MKKSIIQNRELFNVSDGIHETNIKEIKIYKTKKYEPLTPLIYDVCLILVLQGKKIANLANTKSFTYDCENYLVVPATLPLLCETYATEEEPFICLLISLDRELMLSIIEKLKNKDYDENGNNEFAIFSDEVTKDIEKTTEHLLDILESTEKSSILGYGILKELLYNISIGQNAKNLHKMFLEDNNEFKIANALKLIHDNYVKAYDIETLARLCDMSVASFHSHFKRITLLTPLQYIKKIRLTRARDLLIKYNYQVVQVSNELGYDNQSHFSRDFKNYFGYSPKEAKFNI